MPQVALLTDFGEKDYFVGVMKGVISGINPLVRTIDLSHSIRRQAIAEASFVLWASRKYFPDDTVFVCVVDPGVGTARKIICGEIDGQLFLAPDNGLLDYIVADAHILKFYEVTNRRLFREEVSGTFHGRDIFAPVAARISKGLRLDELGEPFQYPKVKPFHSVIQPGVNEGKVVYHDVFGNVLTSFLWSDSLRENAASIRLGSRTIRRFLSAYSESKSKELIALKGSSGLIEIAVNRGDASRVAGSKIGQKVVLKVSQEIVH